MLIHAPFQFAASRADEIALIENTGSYTYRQFAAGVLGLSQYLRHVTQKSTVGLLLPSSAGFAVSFYATLVAGKTAVPINFLLGDRELKHIIADSGIDTVLTIPFLAGRVKDLGVNVIDLTALPKPDPASIGEIPTPKFDRSPDDMACLLYTSGTSGLPKGVELSFASLQVDIDSCIEHVQMKGGHRFLGIVPLFHSTGLLATLLAPVQLGAQITYIARFSPVATAKAIKDRKISVMVAVPSMYAAMIRLKDPTPDDFAGIYAAISGGEPLPPTVREGFKARYNVHLIEGYGLTETCGPISVNTPEANRPGSVGRIIPNVEVKITDENGNAMPRNETGEVWMKGTPIFSRYHNLPDATAEAKTPDGFFKSGDLGKIDDDGYLWITGRKKDLIIIAGEKVYPREVEDAIALHPDVVDVAVLGKKDPSRGEVVVAFVIPKEGATVTADAVRDFARDRGLAQWKCPREVFVVNELPRSPTGKVLKRVLAEQLAS